MPPPQILCAARYAFDKGPWSKATCYDRSNLLRRLADLVELHRDELAALEALDNGKPYHVANAVRLHSSSPPTYQPPPLLLGFLIRSRGLGPSRLPARWTWA
jgi:hypothetical protein